MNVFTITSTLRSPLQLPFESFYSNNAMDTFVPASMVVIVLEMILLAVALFQLIRFSLYTNIHLKKIIHALIVLQLLASIAQVVDMSKFWGIEYQPFLLFAVQEAAFMFGGLAYFIVLLFWMDFYVKLRSPGPGIKFLQTTSFVSLLVTFVLCYISLFVILDFNYISTIGEGWRLSFKVMWWHLVYYTVLTPVQLYYSYRICSTFEKYYYFYSSSFLKTKGILRAVNFCFVLRTASIVAFMAMYHYSNDTEEVYLTTWPAFICFYIIDQVLPAALFMFLLRKSPKQHMDKLAYTHHFSEVAPNTPGTCSI